MRNLPLSPPPRITARPAHPAPAKATPPRKPFREQYPFLSSPECPPELKILATQKFTAYLAYKEAHAQLFDCTTLDESFLTVKQLVENYIENQSIFNELKYYGEHGHVLGKHPVFKEYQEIRKLRQLNPVELYILQEKLRHNIWRIQHQLKSSKQPHLRVQRERRLHQKQAQLQEITRLIKQYTKT